MMVYSVIKILFFCLILSVSGLSFAQIPDSTVALPDSAVMTSEDSTKLFAPVDSITYSSEIEEFDISDNSVLLLGSEGNPASITYQEMILEAIKIRFYPSADSAIAEGIWIEANPDSFPDGKRYIGQPVVTQSGQDPLTGMRMVFNLKTRKGSVEQGRTQFEGGFYYGENMTRINTDYIQIDDGYYTTCDKQGTPHFHFKSKKMKLKLKDKVVARPIVLYIADIPVFMVPFGVFPLASGRKSGFIIPSYGNNSIDGRYLQGGGYYWAVNDYVDIASYMDFYDKAGIVMSGDLKYNKRYSYQGSMSGSITRRKDFASVYDSTYTDTRKWQFRINHRQQFDDPGTSFSISGSFQNGKSFDQLLSNNVNERANRSLSSNATFSKRIGKNSFSVNISRFEDLVSGNTRETLPSIRYDRSSPFYPFKKGSSTGGSSGNIFKSLNLRYNSSLDNRRSKTDTSSVDSVTKYNTEIKLNVNHNITASAPTKVFKYFNISPNANYKEDWFNEAQVKYLEGDSVVVTDTEKGFFARRTYNMGVSFNTKFYGMFNTNLGRVKTIRHVVTPSVSFSYRPDFSDLQYGYYSTYVDSAGEEQHYDRFGGTGDYGSKSMSISLQNLFQVKTLNGEKESKFDIIRMSSSTNYNFMRPDTTRKLSNLSTTMSLLKFAKFNFNMSHSFYKTYVDSTGETVNTNELLIKSGSPFKFLRFRTMSISTNFSYKSKKGENTDGENQPEGRNILDPALGQGPFGGDFNDRFRPENELSDQSVPWEISGNARYELSKTNPLKTTKKFKGTVNLKLQLTQNWRIGYRGDYDLIESEITRQSFSFYRDLHCWELSANWNPSSYRSGIWLEIRVKDPTLSDLKIKKTSRAIGF